MRRKDQWVLVVCVVVVCVASIGGALGDLGAHSLQALLLTAALGPFCAAPAAKRGHYNAASLRLISKVNTAASRHTHTRAHAFFACNRDEILREPLHARAFSWPSAVQNALMKLMY